MVEPLTQTEMNVIERHLTRAAMTKADTVTVDVIHLRTLYELAAAPTDADLSDKIEQLQDDLNMANAHAAVVEQQHDDLLRKCADLLRVIEEKAAATAK